jgi:molybdopterin-containing oxidoreductase family membrane subunit
MLNEYLTTGYIWGLDEATLLSSLYSGEFALYFWAMVFCLVIPIFLVAIPKTRTVPFIVLGSILVNVSMWLKRFVIIVPSLYAAPLPQTSFFVYIPSLPELSIALGGFFGFGLMLTIFSKLFPLISIWEVSEVE